jgi:Arc/MetJ-type ribon-helix-helix transcriptional regulator
MPASKINNTLFSIALPKEHSERINAIVKDDLPQGASRNALFAAICALITPDEARKFYQRAVDTGVVGNAAEAVKKRKAARELLEGMTMAEIEAMLAAKKAG